MQIFLWFFFQTACVPVESFAVTLPTERADITPLAREREEQLNKEFLDLVAPSSEYSRKRFHPREEQNTEILHDDIGRISDKANLHIPLEAEEPFPKSYLNQYDENRRWEGRDVPPQVYSDYYQRLHFGNAFLRRPEKLYYWRISNPSLQLSEQKLLDEK